MKTLNINRAGIFLRLLGGLTRLTWRYHVSGPLHWPKLDFIKDRSWPTEIQVHKGCGAEAVNMGDDGISVCTGCETIVEGDTEYISLEAYEAAQ